jgi:putative redox protein
VSGTVPSDGGAAAPARKPSLIQATWVGEHRFDTGRPGGTTTRLDGSGHEGLTPPDALLASLAACSGVDVVDILAKRRTPVARLSIEVQGERRETPPRRFVRLTVTYAVDGDGIDAVHAERAVQLAFEKYCSVAASLAKDTAVETIVVVNGVAGPARPQHL